MIVTPEVSWSIPIHYKSLTQHIKEGKKIVFLKKNREINWLYQSVSSQF